MSAVVLTCKSFAPDVTLCGLHPNAWGCRCVRAFPWPTVVRVISASAAPVLASAAIAGREAAGS
jgi:hypothetical protein